MIQGILPCAGRGILHTAGPHSFRNIFICIRSVKMMGAKTEGPDLRHARFVHFFLHAEALLRHVTSSSALR